MRFWIAKNGELPVREQLVRQVTLAILSEDLPPGQKLPSIRELARRYKIHSNTVSAALRRGSGLYVRSLQPSGGGPGELDVLLQDLLRAARSHGHEPDQVLHRLEELILPRRYSRIAVVEPEPGMRQILEAEMKEQLSVPIDAPDPSSFDNGSALAECLVAALPTRAAAVRKRLPRGIPFMTLRLRSVRGTLEGQTRPTSNAILSIVSKSPEFRQWARAVLIAVGLDAECLCEVDATVRDWQERTKAAAIVVADVVSAKRLPGDRRVKVFRVIADSCIAEMKKLCGA